MIGSIIVSLEGVQISPKEKELLSNPKVGGLVLFRENWQSNADDPVALLRKLVSEIRAINPNILIMVDHEGDKVWRFRKGFTVLPAAKTFGETYDKDPKKALEDAFNQAKIMATELKDCGIDLSLAPVIDLDGISNVIGGLGRAFHHEPRVVAEIAEAFIKGMLAAGMPATAKHFPGHGSCKADSHIASPRDERSLKELENDLLPFKILIEKGLLGAVMPAHVTYPVVDPDHAAGFSSIWLQKYLRGWGFQGVIMSDCLTMEGANIGSFFERLQAAQNAGCDFLMLTHQHREKLDALLNILNDIPDVAASAERRQFLADSAR